MAWLIGGSERLAAQLRCSDVWAQNAMRAHIPGWRNTYLRDRSRD
jgi:hypothetical protein